jgi:hypothetical protein
MKFFLLLHLTILMMRATNIKARSAWRGGSGWCELPQRSACSKACRHTRNAQCYQTPRSQFFLCFGLWLWLRLVLWPVHLVWMTARLQQDTFLSWHLAPAAEVTRGLTLSF